MLEEMGISFRAMNDASNLYLLVRGTNSDGRVLMSGKFRQNVTFWFLSADQKSRVWGINLDFSRAHSPEAGAPPTLAAYGIAPEKVVPQGLEVSTATFPSDLEFQADLSSQLGRQPIYEIRIPLALIEPQSKSIYMDFVTSEVSPDVKAELQSAGAGQRSSEGGSGGGSSSGGGGMRGGSRRHRGGGAQGGSGSKAIEAPKPLDLHLTIGLAKEPKH